MALTASLLTITKIAILIIAIIITGVISFFGVPIAVLYLVIATIFYWQKGAMFFSGTDILILTILTVLAVFLDNIVLMLGLKKSDASRRGYIGAVFGSIAGFFTSSLIGLAFFSALGAVVGELVHGKDLQKSIRSGMGAAASLFFGSILRAVLTLIVAVEVLRTLLF